MARALVRAGDAGVAFCMTCCLAVCASTLASGRAELMCGNTHQSCALVFGATMVTSEASSSFRSRSIDSKNQ